MHKIKAAEVQFGDVVRVVHKSSETFTTTFEGRVLLFESDNFGFSIVRTFNIWTLDNSPAYEVFRIEQPYILPTDPGIYIIEGSDYLDTLSNRIAVLDEDGEWWENGDPTQGYEFTQYVVATKNVLKKIF